MSRPFYGFISNRCTGTLVSPIGVVEWLPWPRFDGDAVFCRLLDDTQGGFLSTLPLDPILERRQSYVDGTLLLQTGLVTSSGQAVWTDFLPLGRAAFWRRIETDVPLRLICRPTFGFGAANASYELRDDGALFYHPDGSEGIQLHIRGRAEKLEERDAWLVGPGPVDLQLRYAADIIQEGDYLARPLEEGDRVETVTRQYWRGTAVTYHGPWQEWVHQSALTLRGLSYRNNGAMLAAATTSLPEVPGEQRQWDYRYVWVRDGAYGAEALLLAGDTVSCRQFLEFMFNVMDLVEKPYPSPFVCVDGTLVNGERELLWLSGYHGSRPVRVGNAASSQVQGDIEGGLLWLLLRYWRLTGDRTFIRDYWWAVEAQAEWLRSHWQDADASLWEFRDAPRPYTHSRALAWVGLGAAAALALEVLNNRARAVRWRHEQDRIKTTIYDDALQHGGRFTQSFGVPGADAALLTLPLYGFVAVSDPIFRRTLALIEAELVQDGLVFRYRQDPLGHPPYPFTLAGFWLARVYLRQGRMAEADAVIGRHAELATELKLFAEHVDAESGEPHGNFPQLFPHAGLVTALMERQRVARGAPLWRLP